MVTLIFAKAPVPGQVKTRLCRAIGARMAARIYVRLLERTVEQAVRASLGPVWLVGAPDCTHPVLADLVQCYGLVAAVQQGEDLGQRMLNAMRVADEAGSGSILIGSDCLDLDASDLRDAGEALASGAQVVLGPSGDGGYVLIGARRVDAGLFRDMPWSSPRVLQQTRHAILALGWSHRELRVFRDLDVARDLALIPRHWRLP